MNKIYFFCLQFVALLFLMVSCDDSWRRDHGSRSWNSYDPYSVPLDVRSREFRKGNIISNSSFEKFDISFDEKHDSVCSIDSWKIIGRGVSIEEISDSINGVTDSKYCLKIFRPLNSIPDSIGSGVISDFISVVPGNYVFSMAVKLMNVSPQSPTISNKLYKSINIKIDYFNEYKKPLSSYVVYPDSSSLDVSFKGFGFANFSNVDSLPWSKYFARSSDFPCVVGDIPDSCRYVKVFIGLNSPGTMWVDNVSLQYSKSNFTQKEKMDSLLTENYSHYQLLIPTPKKIVERDVFKISQYCTPALVCDSLSAFSLSNALNSLKLMLENCLDNVDVPILSLHDFEKEDSLYNFHIFVTVSNSKILESQAYSIRCKNNRNVDEIFVTGSDVQGAFWGLQTLSQLVDTTLKVVFAADIDDYPDYNIRPFMLDFSSGFADTNLLNEMLALKLNSFSFNVDKLSDNQVNRSLELGGYFSKYDFEDFTIIYNPYSFFGKSVFENSLSDSLRFAFSHDENSVANIEKILKRYFDVGAKSLQLELSDFLPYGEKSVAAFSLWNNVDKLKFVSLSAAHAFLINKIYMWFKDLKTGGSMSVCSPWYNNQLLDAACGISDSYFNELLSHVPKDVSFVWSGPSCYSLNFDDVDVFKYKSSCSRRLIFADNSFDMKCREDVDGSFLSDFPEKVVLCSFLEPYFSELFCLGEFDDVFVNLPINSEFHKIKYAAFADYLWNCKSYNPEISLWKVLVRYYGFENAPIVISLNDSYFKILRYVLLVEKKHENVSKYRRLVEDEFVVINKDLKTLKSCSKCENIVKEFDVLRKSLFERWQTCLSSEK